MTEDELIKEYFFSLSESADVSLGIGDDAAILNVPANHQLVTSVDTLLEGVHFPESFPPYFLPQDVASRAVAVCVSDLAAMGATPKWLTLALSLPEVNREWLHAFSQSLHTHCAAYGLHLVGGDTVKGGLALTLNVMGIVATGQALRRDTAQVDDLVYVSGSLGGAAFALSKLLAKSDIKPELLACFTQPQARIELGQALIPVASSCMDVSDGILLDAARLATASGLGIQIDLDKLPLNPELQALAFEAAVKFATGGDDYELLFTVPPQNADKLASLEKRLGIPLTHIGRMTEKLGLDSRYKDKTYVPESRGYQHFD